MALPGARLPDGEACPAFACPQRGERGSQHATAKPGLDSVSPRCVVTVRLLRKPLGDILDDLILQGQVGHSSLQASVFFLEQAKLSGLGVLHKGDDLLGLYFLRFLTVLSGPKVEPDHHVAWASFRGADQQQSLLASHSSNNIAAPVWICRNPTADHVFREKTDDSAR